VDNNNFIRRHGLPLFLGISLLLAACSGDQSGECRPDPAAKAPVVALKLQRLEKPFFRLHNQAEALQFINAHPAFARFYLQRQPGNEAALAGAIAQMATNKDLAKLKQETEAAFPDSTALTQSLGELFRRVHHYFPDFRVPPAYTYLSGLLGKDIYVNDSLLVLSLDWFAGPKASYRPDLPQYMLRRYTPAHLLPALAQNVSSKYNKHELTANTMLDAMIHSGKSLYFASQVLPCTADSLVMGFTAKEMVGVEANEGKIWGHFLEKNLLYSTTPFLVQKYVSERPNVPEIDKTCPGRVGQWVGLQIVRKYMAEHPDVTLARLMAETNAQRLLTESHYRPKRN
jgi:hypothetical protein